MISIELKQFKQLSKKGDLVPLYQEIPADLDTPVSAFLKIRSGNHDFLLESAEGAEKWGRYSFLGTKPQIIFRSKGNEIEIIKGRSKEKIVSKKDPLESLKRLLKNYKPVKVSGLPRFFGGAVGYLGYDMIRFFEKMPQTAVDDLGLYESYFLLTDCVVIFDNFKRTIKIVSNVRHGDYKSLKHAYESGCRKIQALISKLNGPTPAIKKNVLKKRSDLTPLHTEKEYGRIVERAKEYIRQGDIFQIVPSTRFQGTSNVDPFQLYRSIRQLNPSPYLYFLQLDDVAIVGASPEVMVRMEDKKIDVRPIAGTRRRGRDEKDDLAMEKDLMADPKERAEHIMLVDLGRNDVGRVAKFGTVHVDELETIERYSHVMHIVSHVSGELKKGRDAFDVIRATFPAGTLSGAPKIRAMEIIEELEGRRRGIYGGCVGYISFTGNTDMAITIRTALFKGNKLYVQAGGGVVFESVPRLEYKECCNKARGMMKALEMS